LIYSACFIFWQIYAFFSVDSVLLIKMKPIAVINITFGGL